MGHDVFICYAREDAQTAETVCAGLEGLGTPCWIAPRDIQAGTDFASAIAGAVTTSRALVLVFGLSTGKSTYVAHELQFAYEQGIPILPLRVDDAQHPAEMALALAGCDWLDVRAAPIEQHLAAIQAALERLKTLPRPERTAPAVVAPTAPPQPPFEAYTGDEPYIFVSYSHKDSAAVYPEIARLHGLGYRIWYDEGIDPGNEWPEEVANALADCAQFLVFVSHRAVESKNVRNEINFAINRDKPFVAIHTEETRLPTGLELRLGDIQAIFRWRMDEDRYLRQMEKALPDHLRSAPEAPALPGFPERFCFVIASYGDSSGLFARMSKVVEAEWGIPCLRADDVGASANVLQAQLNLLIQHAELVIALVSGLSPNVYGEIGFAIGQSKPILLVGPKDEPIPTGFRGHEWLLYGSTEAEMQAFEDLLAQHLRARRPAR